jgi:Bifunctional DNA primase/polymerase, N-terminal
MTRLLEAALGYAARGIPVYPVHWPRPIAGGASLACSCSRGLACDRPAKHPLLRHGVKEATTDPDRIGPWWRRWPQANLGLATGIIFDALDVDAPPAWPPSASSHGRWTCGSPVHWWPPGAVAGTTGSPRPGWAIAHRAA